MAHFLRSQKIFRNQHLIHIIGDGSSYDEGMETIEMFVRHHKNPEKEQYKYALMNYYISNLLNYWNGLEDLLKLDIDMNQWRNKITFKSFKNAINASSSEYLEIVKENYTRENLYHFEELGEKYTNYYDLISNEYPRALVSYETDYKIKSSKYLSHLKDDVFVKRATSVIKGKDLIFITENFWKYYEYFNVYLENIKTDFTNSNVYLAFNFLTKLLCLNPGDMFLDNIFGIDKVTSRLKNGEHYYFLANYTGYHSLNSYLYGIMSGINIVGVPSYTLQEYDNSTDCPTKFMDHDMNHEINISKSLPKHRNYYETLYYRILNNNEYNREMKELMIFTLWFDIHEQRSIMQNDEMSFYEKVASNGFNNIDALFPTGTLDNLLSLVDINLVRTFFPPINEKSYRNILLYGYVEANRLLQ